MSDMATRLNRGLLGPLLLLLTGLTSMQLKMCTKSDLSYGFSECSPDTQNRTAFFYYKSDLNCQQGSEKIPPPIDSLKCDHQCEEGKYLDLDLTKKESVCSTCPQNTYSGTGILIDGQMEDWDKASYEGGKPLAMSSDCYYQNEFMFWVENSKCQPFESTGHSMKAYSADVMGAYVAFTLTYPVYLKTKGSIEFKYKKESLDSIFHNGDFKFIIDGKISLIDNDPKKNGWQVYRKENIEPGMHTFEWFYTKWNEQGQAQSLSAQIEYLEITGLEFAAKECIKCSQGWSQPGSLRCSLCPADYYIDPNSENKECTKCPHNTHSAQGSVGKEACMEKSACTNTDMMTVYSECSNGLREAQYSWIQPKICDDDAPESVMLPQNQTVACKPCSRGQEADSEGNCQSCEAGFYQPNRLNKSLSVPETKCQPCGEGKHAPKVLEFEEMEEIPSVFQKSCSGKDMKESKTLCNNVFGWRVDEGMLDSGVGLPVGIRLSLTANIEVVDANGGLFLIDYHTLNLEDKEFFKVYINGVLICNNNYAFNPLPTDFTDENTGEKQTSTAQFDLQKGKFSIEIALESQQTDPNNKSKAQALITKVQFQGLNQGGAFECLHCAPGHVSKGKQDSCTSCPRGFQANLEYTKCEQCGVNMYNSQEGSYCKMCPDFLHPTLDRTKCLPYDVLTTSKGLRYHMHLLFPESVCNKQENLNYCTNNIMGPIYQRSIQAKNNSAHQDNIFFYANHKQFETEIYEYHETNDSLQEGFLFALFKMQNASLYTIRNYLGDSSRLQDVNSECISELQNFRVKKNLGSMIESIGNFSDSGYTIKFTQGDTCNRETGEYLTSQIDFVCNNQTDEQGWPVFKGNLSECHFVFEWTSKWACTQCQQQQVRKVQSHCFSNKRLTANVPEDKCVIVQNTPTTLSGTNTTEFIQSPLEGVTFVELYSEAEDCSADQDFLNNPFLQALLIVVAILAVFLIVSLLIICGKYKGLKVRYSRLDMQGNGDEIEMPTRS